MTKTWRYLVLALAVLGGLLAWILFRDRKQPLPDLKNEVKAIKAEAEVQKLQAELGREKALAKVEQDYQAELAKLDASQKKEAEELKKDPAKLSRFLIRAAR